MQRLVGLLAALILARHTGHSSEGVEIMFFDVGQGDATAVRSREGNVALIDAGDHDEILSHLESVGINKIDLVIASHLDFDHIGGIDDAVWAMPVDTYMDNGDRNNTQSYRSMVYALREVLKAHPNPQTFVAQGMAGLRGCADYHSVTRCKPES